METPERNPSSVIDSVEDRTARLAAELVLQGYEWDGVSAMRLARLRVLQCGSREDKLLWSSINWCRVKQRLLEHLEAQCPDYQQQLRAARCLAVQLMEQWAPFGPYLVGGVWQGIAVARTPLHLQLFFDPPKEAMMKLMGEMSAVEVTAVPHGCSINGKGAMASHRQGLREVDALTFFVAGKPVLASFYVASALHVSRKRGASPERGGIAAVRDLLKGESLGSEAKWG